MISPLYLGETVSGNSPFEFRRRQPAQRYPRVRLRRDQSRISIECRPMASCGGCVGDARSRSIEGYMYAAEGRECRGMARGIVGASLSRKTNKDCNYEPYSSLKKCFGSIYETKHVISASTEAFGSATNAQHNAQHCWNGACEAYPLHHIRSAHETNQSREKNSKRVESLPTR